MEIKPVRRYRTPAYATSAILEQHPELLRLVPKRWQKNPLVITALTGLCILMAGCRSAGRPASHVAPVFIHGEGRGTFGCKAINPPVFLSEDEARQVIVEEAKRAGIDLTPDVKTLRKVALPVTNRYFLGSPRKPGRQTGSLVLDGTDMKRAISYEFVSTDDYYDWGKKGNGPGCSAYERDYLAVAQSLRNGLAHCKPAGTYAVFYHPLVRPKTNKHIDGLDDPQGYLAARKQAEKEARNTAHEDLRAQVKDFIKWLKAEGVI